MYFLFCFRMSRLCPTGYEYDFIYYLLFMLSVFVSIGLLLFLLLYFPDSGCGDDCKNIV